MQMRAKYSGKCGRCNGLIAVGESILWAPGAGARHTTCPPRPIPVAPRAPMAEPAPSAVSDGIYTAVYESGRWDTIRVKSPGRDSKFYGKTMACLWLNGRSTAVGFVDGGRIRVWRRYEGTLEAARVLKAWAVVVADPNAAGEVYALRSGHCWRCDRVLTVPASLNRGVGPECAKVLGMVA